MTGFSALAKNPANVISTIQTEKTEPSYFEKNNLIKVILNISGSKFDILVKNFRRIPTSRLGQLYLASSLERINDLCDHFSPDQRELYFDRDPGVVSCILNYYRTGKLHLLDNICAIAFDDELEYWGISELFLENCCHLKYYLKKEAVLDEMKKVQSSETKIKKKEEFTNCCPTFRKKLWDLVAKPETSIYAKIFSILSIAFVVASLVILVLNSIPDLKTKHKIENPHSNETGNHLPDQYQLQENFYLEIAEIICIVWFTLEYIARLYAAPDKYKFLKSILNGIDLLSILPYFIALAFQTFSPRFSQFNTARRLIALLRILRIIRLFKLARHSSGLQSLGLTLKKSYRELGMLLFFLFMAILFFSSLIYFAENEVPDTQFISIPASFWWAMITVTTITWNNARNKNKKKLGWNTWTTMAICTLTLKVGYGDMIPFTYLGRILTSVCCLFGLIVIAMPIPIIVNNFNLFYVEARKRDKLIHFKQEIKEAANSLNLKLDDVDKEEPVEETKLMVTSE